jgi:hypothetical protein
MNRKLMFAFVAACCLAVTITAMAQRGDISEHIQQLEKDMHHAQMHGDVAWTRPSRSRTARSAT